VGGRPGADQADLLAATSGQDAWKGQSVMFGRMMVEPIVQVAPGSDAQAWWPQ